MGRKEHGRDEKHSRRDRRKKKVESSVRSF